MTPSMILFSVNSIMRLVQTGKIALSDYAIDKPAIFPMVKVAEVSSDTILFGFFNRSDVLEEVRNFEFDAIRGKYFEEQEGMLFLREGLSANDKDTLTAFRLSLLENNLKELAKETFENISDLDTGEIAGAYLVKQWGDSSAERGPLARILFTIGAIAAEFVQVDPTLFGSNSKGDQFMRGLSSTLCEVLNTYIDHSTFNGKAQYAEHALGLMMRASLSMLQQNPNMVVSEKHIEALISNTLKPVVEAIPVNFSINDQLDFKAISEAFTGPAINAALQVICDDSNDFFGDRFDQSKAAGMLSGALLSKVSSQGLAQSLSSLGVYELYKAALTVVAETPELFIKREGTGSQEDEIVKDVFTHVIATLKDVPQPFDVHFKDVPANILAVSLESVGKNLTAQSSHKEWENVATEIGGHILNGFAAEFKKAPSVASGLGGRFKQAQLVDLTRIVLKHIAATPKMSGVRKAEVQQVVSAVTQAMIADEHLLLSDDNWKKIAAIAAQEAAANPSRLFAIDTSDTSRNLAADLIKLLLESAGVSLSSEQEQGRSVLFGNTLEKAIALTLRTYSGAPQLAEDHHTLISKSVTDLSKVVAENSTLFGSKEWLFMYHRILLNTVSGGEIIQLANVEDAKKLLAR